MSEYNGRHFPMHFLSLKLISWILILLMFIASCLIKNMQSLFQVMSSSQIRDKPLLGPVLIKIYDTMWCHYASMN